MSHDTWIHRVARVGVRPLVDSRVSPNHITTLRLLTGVMAAAAFAEGSAAWQAVGGGIFVFSMVLDRADGELARLSGKHSAWGHKYDLITDSLCNALAFVGLGIGQVGASFGLWAILLGVVAGTAISLILYLVILEEQGRGARAAELPSFFGFDPDDAIIALPIAVWLGWSDEVLVAAALGAPLFAVFMFIRLRLKARERERA
ncbi:MAG: CDP-alcohol phosphatidyltransferase family protein [Kiloniellales bacterium]|nr:CDP-alcohol phosphatidyltransferase family protein [Kiloniellales bacterium]